MSNGKGLGILAFIIGISGLGLGVYTIVFPQVQDVDTNFGIQNTWFKYDSAAYATNPPATDIEIAALTINFTVNSGESVYFLFDTFALVSGAGLAIIQFAFVLDGLIKSPPNYPEVYFASDSVDQYGSVTLQIAKVISAGSHNLTICIKGSHTTNGIKDSTLLVQTFIP
ncbi:MAG: hypothetical protein ACFE9V_18190 [Candidatus Hodarchaeota archaeon]